ncbi:hypothetical protein L6Q96_05830 [Candidatus Binatia bacterium]|nr:hypothetical protein [Candidatus Binatia bacterium]
MRFLPADGAHARRPPAVVRQLVGGGQWQSRRDGYGKRDWQVDLKRRDDGSVGGRVTVVGSSVVQEAKLEAQLDGAEVYGVLVGPDDRQIGTFTGHRVRRSLSGTYTFTNGDTGTWSWRGEPPE